MKKLLFLFILFATQIQIYAHDIIITVDSEKIEAFIETISESDVHYKKASNPQGPTFIISTSKVSSIIFANGEVMAFKNTDKGSTDIAPINKIYKVDNNYVYGELMMNEKEYIQYLKDYCPYAYDQFISGDKGVKMGKGFLFVGIASDILGVIMTSVGFTTQHQSVGWIGVGGMCLGTFFEIVCIPTWVNGARKKANSIETFNAMCRKEKTTTYWSINASQNGIGIALNF